MSVSVPVAMAMNVLLVPRRPGPLALRRRATHTRIIQEPISRITRASRRTPAHERENTRARAHIILFIFLVFEVLEDAATGLVVRSFALFDGHPLAGGCRLGGVNVGEFVAVDGAGA